MANNQWRGDAPAVAQVVTLLVDGTPATGQVYGVTINGKSIAYTAILGDTNASIAASLTSLLELSTTPAEFQEVIWSNDGSAVVTATAATAGVPFELTTSATGTGLLTPTTVTPSTGPNHADDPANWSLGTVPTAGDDVLIDGGSDLLYGLGNLTAAAFASLSITAGFTGAIGLPVRHGVGVGTALGNGYVEYRVRMFPVGSAVPIPIGAGTDTGTGSGPTLVNLACTTTLALTVLATGTPQSTAAPVVNVSGCAAGELSMISGSVGLAADLASLVATVGTILVAGGTLSIGSGASVTTLTQNSGIINLAGTVSTLNMTGGTFNLSGSLGTVTATPAPSGRVRLLWRGGGTISSLTFQGQGAGQTAPVLDCSYDPRAKVLTSASFTGGAKLFDPSKTVTMTNPIAMDRASLATSDLGAVFFIQRT